MNLISKNVLLLMVSVIYSINAYSQNLKDCSFENLSKTKFYPDSMLQFNSYNTFRYDIIANIKNSKYPIELRYYCPKGNYSKTTNAYILRGTKDSLIATKLETYVLIGSVPGFTVVGKDHNESINLKRTQICLKGNYCDLYDVLSKNNFFTIRGSTQLKEFNKKKNVEHYNDSGSQAYFEIKLWGKVRNFIYDYDPGWTDSDIKRGENIHQIIEYLITNIKDNVK
ncbi:hypothetical protein [Pedobacter sp. BMA]|uniref:hypothetical protein n=1 Tax=Pedobacter sp. BMA TaxID=1663685 RepID=UPI00064A3530|nr:hypothetical protein [Pedobacter sp. BMA]KLT63869.1 hypothetical protein AB669_19225 [Pedobacter sp. BMA]